MDDAAATLSDNPHQKLCAVVALVNSRGNRAGNSFSVRELAQS